MANITINCFTWVVTPDTTTYEDLSYQGDKWIILDHQKTAKYIIKKHILKWVDENIFIYMEWIYIPISRTNIKKIIIDTLNIFFIETEIMKIIKTEDINKIYDFIVTIAEDEWLKKALRRDETHTKKHEFEVNYKYYCFDHKKGIIVSYSPNSFRFSKLEWDFSDVYEQEEPKKWLLFLNEILEWYYDKQAIIDFIQEYFWLLFTSSVLRETWLILYWSGANGKGVMLHIIEKILGSQNVSHVWMHELQKDQFVYKLFWNNCNIDSDMQQWLQLDSSIIKKCISGEPLMCKIIRQMPFTFAPTCKFIIATNELPNIYTPDFSTLRRFVIIHLKKSFYWQENRNLKQELEEEIPQIISWATEWLEKLLKRWEFIVPNELKSNAETLVLENDSARQFIEEWTWRIVIHQYSKIPYKQLYQLYKSFCNDTWYIAVTMRKFNKRVKDLWYQEYREARERWFLGIWTE